MLPALRFHTKTYDVIKEPFLKRSYSVWKNFSLNMINVTLGRSTSFTKFSPVRSS